MKVIDLLNKIAKEKKYPKIKFNNSIYEYHDKEHGYCRYYHDNTYICLDTDYYLFDILNDEVEILEEPKGMPEKICTNRIINTKEIDRLNNIIDLAKEYIEKNYFKVGRIKELYEILNEENK